MKTAQTHILTNHHTRRTFLRGGLCGVSGLALNSLNAGAASSLAAGLHHRPRIKRLVHLCMAGGPSHLETFDPKPELDRLDGKAFPTSFTEGQQLAQLQGATL